MLTASSVEFAVSRASFSSVSTKNGHIPLGDSSCISNSLPDCLKIHIPSSSAPGCDTSSCLTFTVGQIFIIDWIIWSISRIAFAVGNLGQEVGLGYSVTNMLR
jgi:hypothetical protein